jgi:hypothetical protein
MSRLAVIQNAAGVAQMNFGIRGERSSELPPLAIRDVVKQVTPLRSHRPFARAK